ncbi:Allergen Fus c 3 [Fusarium oxysporum f. sp. rapae]|uniref:Allergen Fus c 3 n=1 Tax=Fusarium oxysporum f. sp. rapae TaxID=485398 RepID=A0A8J5NKX6_FUSOX|nr:Allergen Fus c 3 [Fusarium oxysporum f. sp. rapae]
MATCDYATDLGGLYWDKDSQFEPSFDSVLNQFNQGTLFVDTSCRIKACDLSTAYTDPAFASFQPLTTSSFEPYTSDLAFSYIGPSVDNDEIVVQSGYMAGSESMEGNSTGATSGTDKKTISARLSKENGFKDNSDDNHQNSEGGPNARVKAKLRSVSRKPKKFRKKPAVTPNTQQARECHNNIEKQYRTRLKLRFERLLTVLQASRREDESLGEVKPIEMNYCFSRGDVLDAAGQRIFALEEENKRLLCKIEELSQDLMDG